MAFKPRLRGFTYGRTKPTSWHDAADIIRELERLRFSKITTMNKIDDLVKRQENPFRKIK